MSGWRRETMVWAMSHLQLFPSQPKVNCCAPQWKEMHQVWGSQGWGDIQRGDPPAAPHLLSCTPQDALCGSHPHSLFFFFCLNLINLSLKQLAIYSNCIKLMNQIQRWQISSRLARVWWWVVYCIKHMAEMLVDASQTSGLEICSAPPRDKHKSKCTHRQHSSPRLKHLWWTVS